MARQPQQFPTAPHRSLAQALFGGGPSLPTPGGVARGVGTMAANLAAPGMGDAFGIGRGVYNNSPSQVISGVGGAAGGLPGLVAGKVIGGVVDYLDQPTIRDAGERAASNVNQLNRMDRQAMSPGQRAARVSDLGQKDVNVRHDMAQFGQMFPEFGGGMGPGDLNRAGLNAYANYANPRL